MKTGSIASNLVALSLGAFLSACGGAEMTDGSELSHGDFAADDVMSNFDQVDQEVTACDDTQYDHWRYLSALAVASANELGRWNIADFTKVNDKLQLSRTGLARCNNGCENINAVLQMQNDETRVVVRHDPGLLRQYMIAYYERQVNWNINYPTPDHNLTLTRVSDDVCGLRYHYSVGNGSAGNTTATSLSGTAEFKPSNSYKCMDIVGISSNDGATVQQYSCSGGSNQKFTVEAQGNNTYRFKANNSGKCLGVVNSSNADTSLLEQRSCGANSSQLFQMNSKGNGFYEIKNVNSGKCIDVRGNNSNDGSAFQLFSCHGGANQTFAISGLSTTSTSSSSSSSATPSALWSRLKFAGEGDNRYLMFQSNASEVSIDPMGTLIDGGSSASSGACYEGSTIFSSTNITGSCCIADRKYGKLARSAWNTKMFMCNC